MTTMILLMGEQPAANLLPVRRYQPDTILVVHSAWTQAQAGRLGRVLAEANSVPALVEPYRIVRIANEIRRRLAEIGTPAAELLFNLTGGTKPMSLAAYDVAQEMGARFLYFQTEGSLSRIYTYSFDENRHPQPESEYDLPENISLKDYLDLYLDDYEAAGPDTPPRPGDSGVLFEAAVADTLQNAGCEVLRDLYPKRHGAVEVDLVFRLGNQIGIMEAKLKAGKRAIDQLVAVGGQRYLGTYIARFVVSARPMDPNNLNLAEAHRVVPIVLEGYSVERGLLSEADKEALIAAVRRRMEPRS